MNQLNQATLIPGQIIGHQMVVSLSPCLCKSVKLEGVYVCGEYAIKCPSCGRVGSFFSSTVTAAQEWCSDYRGKVNATRWAKHFFKENYLIVDTETTGPGDDDEIVEISIINAMGTVIMDSLVKPSRPIPDEVIAIHGITNDMVDGAPAWHEVANDVRRLLTNSNVTAWNRAFDIRLINQTNRIAQMPLIRTADIDYDCAMLTYADFFAESGKCGGRKWQSLSNAARQQGVTIQGQPHRALTDCFTTLAVIEKMAAWGNV